MNGVWQRLGGRYTRAELIGARGAGRGGSRRRDGVEVKRGRGGGDEVEMTAEGLGETEADDIRQAITRALDDLFNKTK